MPNHNLKPWTERDRETIAVIYPRGGAVACQPYLPGRSLSQIRAWATKHGYRYKAAKVGEARKEVELPKTYYGVWQPMKAQERLPVRPGAYDFKEWPSL